MGQAAATAVQVLNSSAASTGWIDVSVPIYDGMVHWPDDPSIQLKAISHVERGDVATVSSLEMGTHTGTHIDGPIHFIPGGHGVDAVPLQNLIGPARVIEISDPRVVTHAELRNHELRHSERLLFKTLNSQRCWNGSGFVSDFVSLEEAAATYLAELNTLAIGIDYLSIGSPVVHRTLFEAGVVIIEGLNLSGVHPGTYDLLCLPLRIAGGDGAPARALLRPPASPHAPQTAQEVFNVHRMQQYEAVLRGVRGTYRFDIDKVGSWFLAVNDGVVNVQESTDDADCVISCDEQDFVDIVEGRRNLITAHMQGRVHVRGDMALAQKFHGLVSAMIEDKRSTP
jgi:arylformamidase